MEGGGVSKPAREGEVEKSSNPWVGLRFTSHVYSCEIGLDGRQIAEGREKRESS